MSLRFRMDKIRYKISKRLWLVNIFERLIAVKSGLRKFSKFPDSPIGDRVFLRPRPDPRYRGIWKL
jgi:hypothetical protein